MGLGMLRRYHARPDEGLQRAGLADAATPSVDETNTPEVIAAREAWEAASTEAADLTTELTDFKTGLDLDSLSEEDQEKITGLEERTVQAVEVADAAKSQLDAAIQVALDNLEAAKAVAGAPARSATKKEWVAYALEHGKTEEDLTVDGKALTRDAIAESYLGPKL